LTALANAHRDFDLPHQGNAAHFAPMPSRATAPGAGARPDAILFSDVDGTLLDERDRLAINAHFVAAFSPRVELVLTSSRTIPELLELQGRLGLMAPLIAENGALVALPPGWRGTRARATHRIAGVPLRVAALGTTAARLRPIVRRCAARLGITPVEQRETLPDRGRAIGRTHSVLLRQTVPRARWKEFQALLQSRGLDATHSGRWLAVTKGADKAAGARYLLAMARRLNAPFALAAAVGNAENDISLLAAAERPFVIRNPREGHDPALAALPRAYLLQATGIAGWREALAHTLTGNRRF
jgi:mannosyl-3-phosphoglycerate phosphatase